MGASLDDVAEQLDVTKGAFYYHIRNKEDLLYQCFQRTLELISEMIKRAQDDGNNGAEKIELCIALPVQCPTQRRRAVDWLPLACPH